MKKSIEDSFEEIILRSHFWNWGPDWEVVITIYKSFPNSYSVLFPFAYSYFEELIRSTTSEYGIEIYDKNGKPRKRKAGIDLIKLTIKENATERPEYVAILKEVQKYYQNSSKSDQGDNRHSVAHGYMHPRFWSKESFEKLIQDIARISKYSGF